MTHLQTLWTKKYNIRGKDILLNDFCTYERAFQLMAQVPVKRRERQDTVYLQTRNIGHPFIIRVMTNDY